MANLKEVKNRINSVSSTQQITKAMKMVAAAKLRRAQENIVQMRPYAKKLSEILQNVSSGADNVVNPYAVEREPNNVLLIAVSSDRGLCGAFNSNIFKSANAVIAEKYASQIAAGNLEILPIGKKAYDYFTKRKFKIVDGFYTLYSELNFNNSKKAAEYIMDSFKSGKYDTVEIIYNEFKHVALQFVRVERFLPVEKSSSENLNDSTNVDYINEPSKEYIIEELIPKSLKVQFYKTLLESNASEQGARMTAMDKATENAGDLLKELKLTYNRTRQAAITKEILEIVAGAEALSGK
jgi:F-type H+-transporting ATPase subunit gamma